MPPALGQRQLGPLATESFQHLLEALRDEKGRDRSVSVTGLPAPAKALWLLAVHHELRRSCTLITRSDADASAVAEDLRSLAHAFGLADPSRIHVFPSLDADPYQGIAPHLSFVTRRMRALAALATGECDLLVASVEALFTPLETPDTFARRCILLGEGVEWREADEMTWFLNQGYERVDMVSAPGEFSRRGGVIDLFLPMLDSPVRIELDGSTIASIRLFDPGAQRSTQKLDACLFTPAREVSLGGSEKSALSRALTGRGEGAANLISLLERQGRFPGVEMCARLAFAKTASLVDHAADHLIALDEPEMTREEARNLWADLLRSHDASPGAALPEPSALFVSAEEIESILGARARWSMRHLRLEGEADAPQALTIPVAAAGAPSYRGRITSFLEELKKRGRSGETTCILMSSVGTTKRMRELLDEAGLGSRDLRDEGPPEPGAELAGPLYLGTSPVSEGFSLPQAGWHLVTERELFGVEARARARSPIPTFASDFRDLKIGDHVVHVDHGVGRYDGLVKVASPSAAGGDLWRTPALQIESMILTYANNDRLYIPMDRLDLVQKYVGSGGKNPPLDRLGGQSWGRTKKRVRKAMEEMAVELLNLYAARKTQEGHAFASDTEWQREFETSFPYQLTPDQARAIEEVKRDMEKPDPMDRLLCGDVGFGKTEVALRAAFKAVMDGKQVAVLSPTTVLAFQHFNTFSARFAPFPTKVEMLSRFRTDKEQDEIAALVAAGEVDIIIGTHRLLSADMQFRELGLLIVDEEQRFGVAHKERIKKLKRSVDVLTLTATPIPRTLQMALMGVYDLSLVETPPESRLAIQTHILPFKESILAPAIRHELQRGGQVYFVHNRVESIYAAANLVQRLVPESRVGVAHGQMGKNDLESAMMRLTSGEIDVLVSTTIIENGLDIPRCNTLIVNRADRFGLSQLYQLRGRIGRSDRQAYAYLLVPPDRVLSETARKRLQALQDFTELGSGFRIAAMDLEIRGAGDLLGRQQHGQIAAVGFEMYCRMLERTIEEMKGGEPLPEFRSQINLGVDLKIPESYIPEEGLRLVLYKKIASARTEEEVTSVQEEMGDRFGRLPDEGLRLLEAAKLRLVAERLHVQQIDLRSTTLQVKFSETSPLEPGKLLAFVRSHPGATLTPSGLLKMPASWGPGERIARTYGALRDLG